MQTDYTAKVKIILVYHGNKYHSQLRFSTFDRFIPWDINLFPSRLVARKNEGKGTFIDKCKRGGGGGNTWNSNRRQIRILRTEWEHKTFPRLFFRRVWRNWWAKSKWVTGIFSASVRDPPIRYRRSVRWRTPATTSRGDKRLRSGVDPRAPTDFSTVPAISSLLYDSPLPSNASSSQFYFLSGTATRFLPILIKRISRHQFRVPWSPRDI